MKLEPEYTESFNAWKAAPSPKTMGQLLKTTAPSLNRAVAINLGESDPIMMGHARRLAAEAFPRYDSAQSSVGTFMTHQLQGLKRLARKTQNIIAVPERISLQRGQLSEAETILSDKLGREPTTTELADHTGLSPKRIEHIRTYKPAVAEGHFSSLSTEDGGGLSPAVRSPTNPRVVELVYNDLSATDRKILEWTIGLHGTKPKQNQAIAAALRLTPGAISQRKALIQRKLYEMADLLPF